MDPHLLKFRSLANPLPGLLQVREVRAVLGADNHIRVLSTRLAPAVPGASGTDGASGSSGAPELSRLFRGLLLILATDEKSQAATSLVAVKFDQWGSAELKNAIEFFPQDSRYRIPVL